MFPVSVSGDGVPLNKLGNIRTISLVLNILSFYFKSFEMS
jgi:hypothetical protein